LLAAFFDHERAQKNPTSPFVRNRNSAYIERKIRKKRRALKK